MSYQKYASELSHKFIRNHEESERILKFLFRRIVEDVAHGRRVYFRGFGSFQKVKRPARKYRNIHTGRIEVRPKINDIEFSPSQKFLDRL